MALSLIRYNYPSLCISNLQTSELHGVYSKHITQCPLLARRTSTSCHVYLEPMAHMESGEVPVLTPLTLIYLSPGAKCLNTLCTLAPSWIVCHLSEHLELTVAMEEEQVVCSKCNKTVSSYKSQQHRLTHCILGEQPTICQKEALLV